MPPSEHAKFGASSMYQWAACPGSIAHKEMYPQPATKFSNEGTLAHDAAEKYLQVALHGDCEGELLEISEEMLGHVEMYVDYCVDLVKKTGPHGSFGIEERFQIMNDCFGTNDFSCWLDFDHLDIVDLKYGMGVEVDPTENKQLMFYALGCVIKHNLDVDIINVHIVQPRVENPIKVWSFDYKRLMEFKTELLFAIAKVDMTPNKRIPGDHCRFCSKAQCPEFREKMYKETTLPVHDCVDLKAPVVEQLSVQQLIKVVDFQKTANSFFDQANALLHRLVESGDIDPALYGKKLVRSYGNTAFKDPDKIPYRKLGLKKADLYDDKLKTATQIKKLVPKDKLEIFEGLVHRPDRGTKIVSESAKGEALLIKPEDTLQLN